MIDLIKSLLDFILHIDKHLFEIVSEYKYWTYLILFLIVFCETGLVVTPFLPGDSLLFAAGALAAREETGLNVWLLCLVFIVAAIVGNTTNYLIGRYIGPKVFERNYRLLNKKYLEEAHAFYEKHGVMTIIVTRFIPIARTFAPFIAGVSYMAYGKFTWLNFIGAFLWVLLFTFLGYYFGNLPAIKQNFTYVIMGIIVLSVMPMVVAWIKAKLKK